MKKNNKNKKVKPAKAKSPTKTATKLSKPSKAKKTPRKSLKSLKIDVLDRILLKMGQKPYNKIISQIELGKKRLNDERRLALQIGNRILAKAKKVRDSWI